MSSETLQRLDGDGISDARLAAIVDSSFDAIIGKDLNSIITTWNRAAETLFGYTSEEAIGKSVVMLIPKARRSEEDRIIARIKDGERIDTFETVRVRKDGKLIPVSLTISPIRNREGVIVGASKIARDNSPARDAERQIRLLLREVNHRVKNQYAVILSIIRETGKRATNISEFEEKLRERIMALSGAHDLLVMGDWIGAELAQLVSEQLRAFPHENRVFVSGPMVTVSPNAVQHLAMAFHELATNSAKHGVLASGAGNISIRWDVIRDDVGESQFQLDWVESFAEPFLDGMFKRPRGQGFGTVILKRVAPQSLGGTAIFDTTETELVWRLRAPARSVISLSD
jgi:PAS domain S-box-containing protein